MAQGCLSPPAARPRQELHEAIGLGRRGVDHLPHVELEALAHERHLVGEADVDRAEGVLEELDHLGGLCRRHRHRLVDGLESRGLLQDTLIVLTSDHGEGLDEAEDHYAIALQESGIARKLIDEFVETVF